MKLLRFALILCLWPWEISHATTSIQVIQRDGDDVTLQCKTDKLQILWRIGDQLPIEAESYVRNGSFILSTINTTITERTTIVCTGNADPFLHQTPERDNILLYPLRVSPTGTVPTSMAPGATTEANDNTTHSESKPTDTDSSVLPEVPSHQSTWIVVGCVVGGGVLLSVLLAFIVVCMWKWGICRKKNCMWKRTPDREELRTENGTPDREAPKSVPVQNDPRNDPALPCGSNCVVHRSRTREETVSVGFRGTEELLVFQPKPSNLRSPPQQALQRNDQFEGINQSFSQGQGDNVTRAPDLFPIHGGESEKLGPQVPPKRIQVNTEQET